MFKVLAIPIITVSILFGWYFLKKETFAEEVVRDIVYDFEEYCDLDHYPIYHACTYADVEQELRLINSSKEKDDHQFISIKPGQNLHSILRKKHITSVEIYKLELALKSYLSLKDLLPGDKYKLSLNSNKKNRIEQFILKKLNPERIPIYYQATKTKNNNFIVDKKIATISEKPALIKLKLKGSLFSTFKKIPFGNELMQRFIGIFVWQMRIPQDIYPNDEIKILVNHRFADDELIGYSNIISASYKQKRKSYFAVSFTSKDNLVTGFFDKNGQSVEKEFLYWPVKETIATSSQKWRLHPIKKIRIRHNGTDYRGSIGTEFFAIADGKVIENRYDHNAGNIIRIKHKYGIYSEYFHAQKIYDLPINSNVKRGQAIGTIGDTGKLCSGPHLHLGLYRFRGKRKQFISLTSLRRTLKSARDIDNMHMVEFKSHLSKTLALVKSQQKIIIAKSI